MYDIFFISDMHFTHENFYSFYNYDGTKCRPFNNADEADEYMVQQWNKTVRETDKIYVLGDVGFNKNKLDLILPRLNGKKCLIKGNHDNFKIKWYCLYFYDIRGCYNFENYLMTHIPVHPESKSRFKRNLHGHVHANSINDPWYRNCCVDVNNYTPISYELIKQETKELGF